MSPPPPPPLRPPTPPWTRPPVRTQTRIRLANPGDHPWRPKYSLLFFFPNLCLFLYQQPMELVNQDLEPFTLYEIETGLKTFNKNVKESVENENQTVLKTILLLEPILTRQRKLPKHGRILTKLGFKDPKVVPLAHDFTFPNATDVFGWTKGSWSIFDGIQRDENSYKTLDLAGQSGLHHAIDRYGDLESLKKDGVGFAQVLYGYKEHKLLDDSGLLTAKCNKQTPLHRAARTGNRRLVEILLKEYAYLCAALYATDFYGRTTLCLAAQYGKSEAVDVLCEKMGQDGLNRTGNYERNALHYVVLNHKEDAALNLIEHKIIYDSRIDGSQTISFMHRSYAFS